MANIARGQGSLLLINYFFGTMVNGAFAVAKAIERNIHPFAFNIQSAAEPQITQSYSSGDMERVFFLTSRIGKYCLLMMMMAFFPLWAELDYILGIWLITVPEGASLFSKMILLLVFVSITDGGLGHVVNASGKVSRFKTTYSLMTLMCIPIGFVILKAGSPAYMILVIFIIADLLWRVAQICMMKSILHFPVMRFCCETYLPVFIASLPVVACMYLTSLVENESDLWHIAHFVLILFAVACSIYCLGLKAGEREKVFNHIKRICQRDRSVAA